MSEYLRHDSYEITGSATTATTFVPSTVNKDGILAVEVKHFNSIFVQLLGTWAGTVTWETSQDGVNWVGQTGSSIATNNNQGSSTTANGIYALAASGKYFRLRCSAYTSGTIQAVVVFSSASPTSTVTTLNGGSVNLSTATTQGAPSWLHRISTADTNSTSVKGSAGNVNVLTVSNNGAAVAYLKLYDKASAPTVGTDTPVATILVPINGTIVLNASVGLRFSTGIALAITAGMAVTDTTAVAAAQVSVAINYT